VTKQTAVVGCFKEIAHLLFVDFIQFYFWEK